MRRNIAVCTGDPILGKKVRFLLARDECEVNLVTDLKALENQLKSDPPCLIVLSRKLGQRDGIDVALNFDTEYGMPPTIVLGGKPATPPDFIRLLPDPIDTKAIFREATELLSVPGLDPLADDAEIDGLFDEKTFLMASEDSPVGASMAPALMVEGAPVSLAAPAPNDEYEAPLAFTADEDEHEVNEPSVAPHRSATDSVMLAGMLNPTALARLLARCAAKRVGGALTIVSDDQKLVVHFHGGVMVAIETNARGDRLGRTLVELGAISESTYGDAAKAAVESGVSVRSALVDNELATAEAIGDALGQLGERQLANCFLLATGAFELDAETLLDAEDRIFKLNPGRAILDGMGKAIGAGADVGNIDPNSYFKLRSTITQIADRFPLDGRAHTFLEYSGRAYKVADAAERAGLTIEDARHLLLVLEACEELRAFTPGVDEFEARLQEEQARYSQLPGATSHPAPSAQAARPNLTRPPAAAPIQPTVPIAHGSGSEDKLGFSEPPTAHGGGYDQEARGPASLPSDAIIVPPVPSSMPAAVSSVPVGLTSEEPDFGDEDVVAVALDSAPAPAPAPAAPIPTHSSNGATIPPMPGPPQGTPGGVPRPVVFAPPQPRGPDGNLQDTAERVRSREHFQGGVGQLGQGAFREAEEAFREAVALCSEEHVYLVGLARAVYYNPSYAIRGKLPALRSIVDRALKLAPGDARVTTLEEWITAAEMSSARI